jgi:hypothetical protein
MPSDDLVLNVKQIANYTQSFPVATDLVLVQRGGIGGPYFNVPAQDLVAESLIQGDITLTTGALGLTWLGGPTASANAQAQALNFAWGAAPATFTFSPAGHLTVADQVLLGRDPGASMEAATARWVAENTVASFNGRTGPVCLTVQDIINAGGAPLFSPVFGGSPRAPTPAPWSNSSRIATTGFVQRNSVEYIDRLLACQPFVFTFNGRSGEVVLTEEDILAAGGGTVFDNINLTGIPTSPTAAPGTNTNQIATTAFVIAQINASTQFAPIDSPDFIGFPSGPTAPTGTATGQLATTAFVANAVQESTTGVASFNGRVGNVTLMIGDIVGASGAPVSSPNFTGIPTAPTATPGTANTQIATTAFVAAQGGVASFNTRQGAVVLTQADIIAAAGAPINGPLFTGIPEAATAAAGTNSTQLATTAFVASAIASSVVTFNGRVGAVTLNSSDVSAAGGATTNSPVFTGNPQAPTPAPGDNDTSIATTAYVQDALLAGGGVLSFNGRAGVVTLTAADITAAGGALLASVPAPATSLPLMDAIANAGSSALFARGDHIHPSDTSRLALTGGIMTGPITVPFGGGLVINGAAGSNRSIVGATNGSFRWVVALGNPTAETGGSAGSAFSITPYNDGGTVSAGIPFVIGRATGAISMGGGLTLQPAAATPNTVIQLLATGGNVVSQMFYNSTAPNMTWTFGSSNFILAADGSFNISSAVATKPGGGAWAASSDDRIKTVSGDYAPGLDELLTLRPVVFTFKGNDTPSADGRRNWPNDPVNAPRESAAPYTGSPHYQLALDHTPFVGFIAQELEAACPGMVRKVAGFIDGQPVADLRQVDVSNLVYMLVNAVKALAAKVDALEMRMAT